MSPAEDAVQRQLNAYNAQDLDAFCACYRADVRIEDDAGVVTLQGIEPFRRRYAAMFAAHPSNRARVTQRIVLGDWVVDEEFIEGRGGEPVRAIAIFHIGEGLIDRVRFLTA